MTRFAKDFPTRRSPARSSKAATESLGSTSSALAQGLTTGIVHRFILGLDVIPTPMTAEEIRTRLRDPFAELLLKRGVFPLTTNRLLEELNRFDNDPAGLPTQHSFVVADGGKIRWSSGTESLNRFFRIAVSRSRGNDFDLLISTGVDVDSPTDQAFVQVIGWDPENQVFNYYERRGGTWIWAGDSRHALLPESRGQGPFDSHVNGSLVMKELKLPWNHWHSQSSTIDEDALAPNDPLRIEPLFTNRTGAEFLERAIVRPGIEKWTDARIRRLVNNAEMEVAPLMRHCLEGTTINLVSSDQRAELVADDDLLRLPISFFLNADAFFNVLQLDADISPIKVHGRDYSAGLSLLEVARRQNNFIFPGETLFAFLVPEFAYEDLVVVDRLLRQGVLSERLGASLLMIDFPNPVYSLRRRKLMAYMPSLTRLSGGTWDLEQHFVAKLAASPEVENAATPEAEFQRHWSFGATAWRSEFQKLLGDYFDALQARAATPEGCLDYLRLAESRRRRFRRTPLAEFDLTLPVTNIPLDAPELFMRPDATLYS